MSLACVHLVTINIIIIIMRRPLVVSNVPDYLFWSWITGPDPPPTYHLTHFWSSNHFHSTIRSWHRTAQSSKARIIECSDQRFDQSLFRRTLMVLITYQSPKLAKSPTKSTYWTFEYTYLHILFILHHRIDISAMKSNIVKLRVITSTRIDRTLKRC